LHRFSEQLNVFGGLLAFPGVAIPDASGGKGVMIAGNYVDWARNSLALEECESTLRNLVGNAVIIENIISDENEVDLIFGSLCTELLDRLEPCFPYPLTSTLLKPSNSET
jgi:hypothetical protein